MQCMHAIKQICELTLIINTPQYPVGGERYDEADQLIKTVWDQFFFP